MSTVDVMELMDREMGELLVELDHDITLCFGVSFDGRWDWKRMQRRKLVLLMNELGGDLNLIPIFDTDSDTCTAVRHELKDEHLLDVTAADLPIVEEAMLQDWQSLLHSAEDWVEESEVDCDTWSMDAGTPNRTTFCYADHLTHEVHETTSDAMSAYETQLGEMVRNTHEPSDGLQGS